MPLRYAFLTICAFCASLLPCPPLRAQDPGSNSTIQSPDSAPGSPFDSAHKLLQQGKYDEAIAKLAALQNQTPPPKGIAHELGTRGRLL
jgi:outer membrane protein assembly factor BamD (BamD/ComL family)